MLDPRRVIHREIHPQASNASPDLKRTPTDGLSTPPFTPEFQFYLAGGRTASPENLFALARSPNFAQILAFMHNPVNPAQSEVWSRNQEPR
jgi:hypothetical protein